MTLCCVSGYWIIKNKHDNKYNNWFNNSLKINSPYIIFGNKQSIEFIKTFRKNLPTYYIELDIDDFYTNASEKEIISFSNAVREVLMLTGVSQNSGGKGFRAIANTGPDGIQEVPHFHLHILGGENLGLRGLRKA